MNRSAESETDKMILIKVLPFVLLVFVERITFSITCTCEDEMLIIQEAVNRSNHNASKLDSCGIVCEIQETNGGNPSDVVIFIVVDNNTFQYSVPKYKIQNITCRINTAGCCNNDSLSSLENTSQQTAKPESTSTSSDASQNVTKETTEETSITTVLTPHATNSQDTPLITTVSKERVSEASLVCECPSNGLFAGAAFIGLFIGVFTTGSISFFLHKRWTTSNKGRALSNVFYELNATQASIRPTAGETYNEIENEPQSPKISYVLPITKDETKSSVLTNNPEIYHHLREDYDVKDRSNYYDHAVPLKNPQEIEPDQYGKLAIEETGAYSTVTNMNKTGPEPVRNEAYSTIETSEFQLVEVEGNNNDNSASYFVLAKE